MENDEHFRRAFMFFDKNGSGYIESNELREVLADDSGEFDTEVLNDIMREVDTDKVRLSSLIISWFMKFWSPPFEILLSEHIAIQKQMHH
jgi:hypothetical protein